MRQQRYWISETGGGSGSTIAMGKNGLPLFWKSWPALYKEAWLIGLRKRVNATLGFDLDEIISEAAAKVRANQAKAKTERGRIEQERRLAQYKKWDLEAKVNEAARKLRLDLERRKAAAPVRRAVTKW